MIELVLIAVAALLVLALLGLGVLAAAGLTVGALSATDRPDGVSLVLRPNPNA